MSRYAPHDRAGARAPTGFFIATSFLLIAALLLGGGRGGLGDVLVQGTALGVLCAHGFLPGTTPAVRRWWRFVAGLAIALPLLHWLVLPLLPGAGPLRDQLGEELAAARIAPGAAAGLHPLAAERALWSLLPALAMCAAALRLGYRQQRQLTGLLLALAVLSLLLGLAQLADGQQSLLRFHSPTSTEDAVGFFANRNHLAALLVASLPLAVGCAALAWRRRRNVGPRGAFIAAGLIAIALILLLGVAVTRSRAGILLGAAAMLSCLPALWQGGMRRGSRPLRLILGAGFALVLSFALFGLLQRMDSDPLDDGRWTYARVVAAAAEATAPWGSGLGSFGEVYPQYEAETGNGPDYAVVNHAHNDVLELWLEARWTFLVLALMFVAMMAWLGWRLWRPPGQAGGAAWTNARLAWISASLLMLHSCVDYPLRTTSMLAVFGMLVALAVGPVLDEQRNTPQES